MKTSTLLILAGLAFVALKAKSATPAPSPVPAAATTGDPFGALITDAGAALGKLV